MSVDRIYLQNSAMHVEDSPEYVPYSKVRIIVGEDEQGNQLVYEAGDNSYRTLEIENPWGTQAIANSILAKLQGYTYKPFTAEGAILNPAAELGDAVNVAGVFSFISSNDTTFSPIMSATISAPEDSNIDHEYPYETSEHKEVARKINGVKTSFIVELGRIATEIEENYETHDQAGSRYEELQSSIEQTARSIISTVERNYQTLDGAADMEGRLNTTITQTADGITQSVSETYVTQINAANTYETRNDASAKLTEAKNYTDAQDENLREAIEASYNSAIEQTASSIKATVAASETKYAVPPNISIAVYGYGAPPSSIAAQYNGRYYLDQSSGYYYRSNGTSWARVSNTPLPLITANLSAAITETADGIRTEVSENYQTLSDAADDYDTLYSFIEQTADNIELTVKGQYADEWETSEYYPRGRIVKVTTYTGGIATGVTYYQCRSSHTSSSARKPGSGSSWTTYWRRISTPSVQSVVDVGVEGISLSVSSDDGSSEFAIYANGVQLSSEIVDLTVDAVNISGTLTADALVANSSIFAGTMYSGTRVSNSDVRFLLGYQGGYYGMQLINRYDDMVFGVYDGDFEYTSLSAKGYSFLTIQGGSSRTATPRGTWDFSNATKVIMPDGTVFQ